MLSPRRNEHWARGDEELIDRKPVGRAEARAQTREQILEAAEELFMSAGFLATTVAQIAAKAGRTQGSLYGNFTGKEALCLEVLKRRYTAAFTQLAVLLAAAGDALDDKLEAVARWWTILASDTHLTVLVAEYVVAMRRDPDQLAAVASYFDFIKSTARDIVTNHLPVPAPNIGALVDAATEAAFATGTGLAIGQVGGLIDAKQSSDRLSETLRLWSARLTSDGDS